MRCDKFAAAPRIRLGRSSRSSQDHARADDHARGRILSRRSRQTSDLAGIRFTREHGAAAQSSGLESANQSGFPVNRRNPASLIHGVLAPRNTKPAKKAGRCPGKPGNIERRGSPDNPRKSESLQAHFLATGMLCLNTCATFSRKWFPKGRSMSV
jgi:hypothetical protein